MLLSLLLAALLLPLNRTAPGHAQDQEWDWAGEWTTVEHLGWIQGSMTIERLDVDLVEFQAMLPTWAYGLPGLCRPDGRFYTGEIDDTWSLDGHILACTLTEEADRRFTVSIDGVLKQSLRTYDVFGAVGWTGSEPHVGEPPHPTAWTRSYVGLVVGDDGTPWGESVEPQTHGGNTIYDGNPEGTWTDEYEVELTCNSGPCLGRIGAVPPGSDPNGGVPLVWVFGPVAAVAAAAAGLARRGRGTGAAPTAPPAEEVPAARAGQQPDITAVIVQVSAEHLEVTSSRPASLRVTGWVVDPAGVPRQDDVDLRLEVPPGSGLTVTPSRGRRDLTAEVRLGSFSEHDRTQLAVIGTYGATQGRAHVEVEMRIDHELQLF